VKIAASSEDAPVFEVCRLDHFCEVEMSVEALEDFRFVWVQLWLAEYLHRL